ncbi:MAG TPA: TonB-dependent receptor, partial [Sphingomonadaceae bacterium]|nr:TonB-dependent receptor [Sphingomonadaceae bacterium]
ARVGYEGPVDGGRGAGMITARGVYSGPLSDSVAIRIGALHSSDRGYFENRFDGNAFGEAETTVLRGALKLRPSHVFTLTLKGEWTGSSGDGAATHNNGQNARDRFDLSINQPGFYDSEAGFAMARGDLQLGPGTLTNIFGWRSYELATRNDIDSSPVKLFESDTATSQEQWSNELYYAADLGFFAITLGGYLFHQDVGYDESRDLTGLGATAIQYGGGRQGHDVYGLYAQADYRLTERLTLTGGLRWSREEKDASVTYVRPRPACSAIAATCPTTGENAPGENNGFIDARSWESLSPRVALSFSPGYNSSLYASWARGQRSGGYNLRITQPAAFEEVSAMLGSPAFDEEKVDTFEIGAKWQSEDGRARVNLAVFRTEVDNMQRELNLPSLSSGIAQSVYNTADARIEGAEIEASFAPAPGLTLTANLGLIDADYQRIFFDLDADNVIDAKDLALELPRAPRSTWGGGVQYEASLGFGTISLDAFFQHRARYAYSDNNWGFNSASDRLDARISLELEEPSLTLSLHGRNLLDEVQFGGDTQLPFAGGPFSNGVNAPFDPHPKDGTFSPVFKGRVLGIEISADF